MYEKLSPFFPAFVVFFGALIVAAGTFWSSYRQSNSGREMRERSEQLATELVEASNRITGGDSFSIALIQPNKYNENAPIQIMLLPKGKYPLYDVNVRFHDLDVQSDILQIGTTFNLGNIIPDFLTTYPHFLPHKGINARFNIFFAARNGGWIQESRTLWVGDGWARADKVEMNGKIVYEEVTANFPRLNGVPDWGARGQAKLVEPTRAP